MCLRAVIALSLVYVNPGFAAHNPYNVAVEHYGMLSAIQRTRISETYTSLLDGRSATQITGGNATMLKIPPGRMTPGEAKIYGGIELEDRFWSPEGVPRVEDFFAPRDADSADFKIAYDPGTPEVPKPFITVNDLLKPVDDAFAYPTHTHANPHTPMKGVTNSLDGEGYPVFGPAWQLTIQTAQNAGITSGQAVMQHTGQNAFWGDSNEASGSANSTSVEAWTEVLAAGIEPRLVRPTLNAAEVIVADVVVTDAPYSADASGARDATAAVQRAIDELSKNGGGVVYMPAGNYRFDGNLTIPGELSIRKKGAQE